MTNRLNVLIVDDNADDALLLARHLTKHGLAIRHRVVDTVAALRDALADADWQVILSD